MMMGEKQWFHDDEFDTPLPEWLAAECAQFYGTGTVGVDFAQCLASFLCAKDFLVVGPFESVTLDYWDARWADGTDVPEGTLLYAQRVGVVVADVPEDFDDTDQAEPLDPPETCEPRLSAIAFRWRWRLVEGGDESPAEGSR